MKINSWMSWYVNPGFTKPYGICWSMEKYCELGVVSTDNIFYFMDLEAIYRQVTPTTLCPVFSVCT